MIETEENPKSILGEKIRTLVHKRSAMDQDFTIEKFCQNLNINKVTYYNVIDGKTKKVDYFLLQDMAKLLNVSFEELTGSRIPTGSYPLNEILSESNLRKTKLLIPKVEPGYDGNKENLNKFLVEYVELDIGNSRGSSLCVTLKDVSPELKHTFQINPGDDIFIRVQSSSLPGKLVYIIEDNQPKFEKYTDQQNIIGQVVFIRRYM